jgi:hypothetical protein
MPPFPSRAGGRSAREGFEERFLLGGRGGQQHRPAEVRGVLPRRGETFAAVPYRDKCKRRLQRRLCPPNHVHAVVLDSVSRKPVQLAPFAFRQRIQRQRKARGQVQ